MDSAQKLHKGKACGQSFAEKSLCVAGINGGSVWRCLNAGVVVSPFAQIHKGQIDCRINRHSFATVGCQSVQGRLLIKDVQNIQLDSKSLSLSQIDGVRHLQVCTGETGPSMSSATTNERRNMIQRMDR